LKLWQCRGKNDKTPEDSILPYVQEFIVKNDMTLHEKPNYIGFVKAGGKYHDLYNLPDNIEVQGSLDLSECDDRLRLPVGMKVQYDLELNGKYYGSSVFGKVQATSITYIWRNEKGEDHHIGGPSAIVQDGRTGEIQQFQWAENNEAVTPSYQEYSMAKKRWNNGKDPVYD